MPLYVRKSCVALTWRSDGSARGLRLRAVSGRVSVEAIWAPDDSDSPVAAATHWAGCIESLGIKDSTCVVAGAADEPCGMADLDLPGLNPSDLRNALAFELNRHAPIRSEMLTWGYRRLPPPPDSDENRLYLRLFYLRENDWAHWLEIASALPFGLDALLPPAVAADPVLAGKTIALPGPPGSPPLAAVPDAGAGRREWIPTDPNAKLDEALAPLIAEFDNLGPLAEEPVERLLDWAPALLLGLYGLTRGPESDRRTLPALPYELRPRRYQGSVLLAAALSLYLLVTLGMIAARWTRNGMAELHALRSEEAALKAELAGLKPPSKQDEALLDKVRQDLKDAFIDRPTLTETLLELTRLIGENAWVTSFVWNDGKIDLQVRSEDEHPGIFDKLRDSPIFLDVVPLGSSKDPRTGEFNLRFQLRAAFAKNPPARSKKPPAGAAKPPANPGGAAGRRPPGVPSGRKSPGAPGAGTTGPQKGSAAPPKTKTAAETKSVKPQAAPAKTTMNHAKRPATAVRPLPPPPPAPRRANPESTHE